MNQLEAEKLQEMDRMKSRFFTNISHEFRTPLTLILAPLEGRLHAGRGYAPDPAEDRIMYRNARRLLQLVNQLLDLAKIESGNARLQAGPGDLVPFVRTLVGAFSSLAESRRIALTFEAGEAALPTYFDKDKVEKVVSNLLSNAFKFTHEGGNVRVELHAEAAGGWAVITVRDSGIGIPADRVGRIFDRFYQVDGSHTREQEGTGIGLALTRELVTLHHGTIEVQSREGEGTLFTVRLPRERAQYRANEVIEGAEATDAYEPMVHQPLLPEETGETGDEPRSDTYDQLPLVLVVEDNADLRHYMREQFGAGYRVLEANDGEAGLQRAIEAVPDLVISDLMMPRMDGFELCRRLKTDQRTSHIPVILLTARAGGDSRVEGLETGADDYLTKPFDPRELRVRVRNLIEGRQKLREQFGRQVTLEPKAIAITSADEKFLTRAVEAVEAHMGNPDFSVERFEEAMTMSKLQLYRKLKALTDQSPSEFIRNLRLKRAAALLAARSGSVAEITYEVGFNNLSYFAKCFRAAYGMSPSEYASRAEGVEK
jgi:DNA-binding response OmpR family regulator/anti-sigma regulatory factor (Ser/Thr protein kinase)